MEFPSKTDFLAEFGLEPIEEDPSMAYCRYVKRSTDGVHELDFSFRAVDQSFQVVLRYRSTELMVLSSEKVHSIALVSGRTGPDIRIVFDYQGITSEALLQLEPDLHLRWWALQS